MGGPRFKAHSPTAVRDMLARVTQELGDYIHSEEETYRSPHPEWANPVYAAAMDMLLEIKLKRRKR